MTQNGLTKIFNFLFNTDVSMKFSGSLQSEMADHHHLCLLKGITALVRKGALLLTHN